MGNRQSEFKSQENTCELGFDVDGRYWGVVDGKSYNALFTPREIEADTDEEEVDDTVADLMVEEVLENQERTEDGSAVEAYVGVGAPDGSHEEEEEWDWIEPVSYGTHVEFEEITVPVSYKVDNAEKSIGKIVLSDKAIFGSNNKPSTSRRNSKEEIDTTAISIPLPDPPKRRPSLASASSSVVFEATFSVPPSPPVVKSKLEAVNSAEKVVEGEGSSSSVPESRKQKSLLR